MYLPGIPMGRIKRVLVIYKTESLRGLMIEAPPNDWSESEDLVNTSPPLLKTELFFY